MKEAYLRSEIQQLLGLDSVAFRECKSQITNRKQLYYDKERREPVFSHEQFLLLKEVAPSYLEEQARIQQRELAEKARIYQRKLKEQVVVQSSLLRQYPSIESARLAACESMFSLNRHAKRSYNRNEIYRLKNKLVETLYSDGFCTDCYPHSFETEAKLCWGCDGAAEYWDEGWCSQCSGTGYYRPSKVLRFVCFDFLVRRKKYSWHH